MDRSIQQIGKTDRGKRRELATLISDVKNIFPNDEEILRLQMVEGLLNQDGTSSDIRRDCEERINMLKENDSCILVSGIYFKPMIRRRVSILTNTNF